MYSRLEYGHFFLPDIIKVLVSPDLPEVSGMSVVAAHELHPSPELRTSVYPDVSPHSQKIQARV